MSVTAVREIQNDKWLTWSRCGCSSKQSVWEQLQTEVLLDGSAFLVGQAVSVWLLWQLTLRVWSHDDRCGRRENWWNETDFIDYKWLWTDLSHCILPSGSAQQAEETCSIRLTNSHVCEKRAKIISTESRRTSSTQAECVHAVTDINKKQTSRES